MQQKVKNQVSEVTDGLKELYTTASLAVGAVAARVERIEERIRGGAIHGQKSLLQQSEPMAVRIDRGVSYITRT